MKSILLFLFTIPVLALAQNDSAFVAQNYRKIERMIPMRDGVRLFTSIYIPLDTTANYPFLVKRTPYSCAPYGEHNMNKGGLGPNSILCHEKYIFVSQDVRGRYKSEGDFDEMTPSILVVPGKKTDESTDTYDTIDWLLQNIAHNNGRVGLYGISYPGFYASASLPNAHPAIKAVSPQAPVTDEFIGDDVNHNGAFFLMDNLDFTNYFEGTRIGSGEDYKNVFETTNRSDAYSFFLKLGPIKNTNSSRFFNNRSKIWNEYLRHNTYDSYWQARNIRTSLKDIRQPVLVVGGWYDAEDLFGSPHTFEAIQKQCPQNNARLVMGPWTHGAWSDTHWSSFAGIQFGQNISAYYQREIEAPFFNFYLKDKGNFDMPAAVTFETGSNEWKKYPVWPPASTPTPFFLQKEKRLAQQPPGKSGGFDQYISDPANPVPYAREKKQERVNEYIAEDQSFLDQRNDVLAFQSAPLTDDITIAGRPKARIYLSATGTDVDLVVKLIDVGEGEKPEKRLIRAEIFRAKFRNSYEHPEPLVPGKATIIAFDLNDIDHVFKKGHRIMIQIQSSWFPLVDRNPQQFLIIPECSEKDFQKAMVKIYHDQEHPSRVELPVLFN